MAGRVLPGFSGVIRPDGGKPRRVKREQRALPPAPTDVATLSGQVLAPYSQYGVLAERLDPGVEGLVQAAELSATTAVAAVPILRQALDRLQALADDPTAPRAQVLAETASIAQTVEKTTRTVLSLVKALDELARLRGFLAGGPDTRVEEIGHMSDRELMAVVLTAAGKCPRCGASFTPEVPK